MAVAVEAQPDLALGQRIRSAREALELRQADLANEAGLSRSVINDLEAGRPRDLGVHKFYRLAAVLGVSMEWLLGQPDLCLRMRPTDWFEHIDWKQRNFAALKQAARQHHMLVEDVRVLASVAYRGQRPTTPDQWSLLHSVIRLACQHAEAWQWSSPERRADARAS